jgi:hypothetical protein
MNTSGAGVFAITVASGSVSTVMTGDPFVTPIDIQISTDGNTLYVIDIGAEIDMTGVMRPGRIFSLSTGGGMPTPITQADGLQPRGIDVVKGTGSADLIYFTGLVTQTASAAVYKMNADGSMFSSVAMGPPLAEPSGVVVTKTGDVYVGNTRTVYKISGATPPAVFAADLTLAFPAGIALSADESALLVSQYDPVMHSSQIGRYTLDGMNKSMFNMGINMTTEAAGLHRAHCADVYSWANASGCDGCAESGGVYVVKGSQ